MGPCPHCGKQPKLKPDSRHLYGGRDFGPVWECECGARCGCHKGTNKPLGTVADAATRKARNDAHAWFDQLWQDKRVFQSRREAYAWLQTQMFMTKKECHIAKMDIDQCKRVCELAKAKNPLLAVLGKEFQELLS